MMKDISPAAALACAASHGASAAPRMAKPPCSRAAASGAWKRVFEHVKGVKDVVSGYAGGSARRRQLRYGELGRHRPRRGRQDHLRSGADQLRPAAGDLLHGRARSDASRTGRARTAGTSYRSAIFPQSPRKRSSPGPSSPGSTLRMSSRRRSPPRSRAAASIRRRPITRISREKHPFYPYIVINDRPKVAALQKRFPKPLESLSSTKLLKFHALFRRGRQRGAPHPI